ncbi:MAG: MerR family transcriptional regulator [Gammaproteobacteria bacterium]
MYSFQVITDSSYENATETGWFPIRTVASLTGVKPVTLRAWERRYQLLAPRRTEKGHRLYSRHDIDRITRLQTLLEQGIPVSQAAKILTEETDVPGVARLDTWTRARMRCRRAIGVFDEAALETVIEEALALYPVQAVTRELLIPLLGELGHSWQETGSGVAEEHFFSVFLRSRLGARFHHRVRRDKGPIIIAACIPGEQHEIGLLFFALAAALEFRLVLLGANLPLEEFVLPTRRVSANGIVLSGSAEPAPGVLERELPALVENVDIPVFVGGAVSVQYRDAITHAAAIPLGEDIDRGLRLLIERLAVEE